jgi:dTDP-4-amino-4,6-dideoxygalactose transaminase
MQVPLMDIHAQYADLLDDVKRAVGDVIDSGRFILGPNVRAFEDDVAAATGASHAVAVANGTDALILGLEALGIGPGDEVVCPAHTFYATAEAVARAGARPVFADIDPATYNLDPAAAEAAVTERTRAIVAVHLFGQPADVSTLRDICNRHGIALVEDAAQAFGATRDGRPAGGFGDVATLSFFPTKNLPAMGDAGMVLTRDADVADRVRMLRFHGSHDKRTFEHIGVNSRMDEMQAAILRVLLPHAGGWNAARRAVADGYARLGLGDLVGLPAEARGAQHVYHLYVVRTPEREALAARLREADVASAVYYGTPLHLQPAFAHLGGREGDLPETERAARECLALPMFPTLDEDRLAHVVSAVRAAAPAAA